MKLFWGLASTIYFIFFAIEYFLLSGYSPKIFGMDWNWGWAAFFAQFLYTIFSFKQVGPTELGAKLLFGKPIQEVSSGLVFIPLLIFQLKKETRLVIQEELPAGPEHIFRNEDKEKVPEGMFPPIRIPFANKPEEDDPLNRRVTAEIVPIIRYRINNYIKFLTTIGDKEAAKKQMEDATIALCMRELTKLPVAEALITLQNFNEELKMMIDELVKGNELVESWGISVETAQIKMINFNHELNKAISSVSEARFNAKAKAEEAEGEKKKRKLEGEGSGGAEKAILDGRTKGLKEMADTLKLDPQMILNAETARAITQNPGQKTIVVGTTGLKEIIGMAAAIGETVKQKKEDKE